jgi:hypothetical protein
VFTAVVRSPATFVESIRGVVDACSPVVVDRVRSPSLTASRRGR